MKHLKDLLSLPDSHVTEQNFCEFEPLLATEVAAKILGGMHPKTLQRKARLGEIPAYQIGRAWFFRASELDSWLKSLIPSNPANIARVN
jgi:excisionase family DNA binding protein